MVNHRTVPSPPAGERARERGYIKKMVAGIHTRSE